jgi:polygalacturonase
MGYGPCENIVVSNCTLTSTSAAIKFGSESEALFRNVLVENCVISRSNRGISLQLRDPGSIENVIFRGLTIQTRLFHQEMFWGQAEPIAITVLDRHHNARAGIVRNIQFRDILCEGENGFLLYCTRPEAISDIRFDNVQLKLVRTTHHTLGSHDLRPTYDRLTPEPGLYYLLAHNASNVSFRDFRCGYDPVMAQSLTEPFLLTGCTGVQL